jgi:hypothetical protein
MINNYYSDTAYDSTRKRSLAPFDKKRKMAIGERTMRKHPLSIPAGQCREYLVHSSPVDIVKEFQDADPTKQQELNDRKLHEYLGWTTSKNKAAVLSGFVTLAGYLSIIGVFFVTPLTGFAAEFSILWLKTIPIILSIPFLFWYIGNYALKHGWVKDGNNVILNRRTGLITLPWENTMISLPFDEFDAFMTVNTTTNATTIMYLRLGHRYSDKSVVEPYGFTRSWEMDAEWEKIQDFMDISKPLPDIPLYDFAREHDPVSAAFDKQINRPKNFWMHYDLNDLKKMHMESVNSAEKYPWGETRELAIKSGWKPSRYSTEDWRKIKKEDTIDFKKIQQEADQGNANSQYDIGLMYEQGKGVPKDYVQAYKWYAIASKKVDEGTYAITALSDKMTSEQIKKGQIMAKNWIILYSD